MVHHIYLTLFTMSVSRLQTKLELMDVMFNSANFLLMDQTRYTRGEPPVLKSETLSVLAMGG